MSRADVERARRRNRPSKVAHENPNRRVWIPSVDVYETDNEYVINAELPGVSREDIAIELKNEVLLIKGERKPADNLLKGANLVKGESVYGPFTRRFILPPDADADNVKARYINGVLSVVIPKRKEVQPKRVEIEVK